MYTCLSSSLRNVIVRGRFRLHVSAYCVKSTLKIRGDFPSIKSKKSCDWPLIHIHYCEHPSDLIGLAFAQLTLKSWMYLFLSAVTWNWLPRKSNRVDDSVIPSIAVGAPRSIVGLGKDASLTPAENRHLLGCGWRFWSLKGCGRYFFFSSIFRKQLGLCSNQFPHRPHASHLIRTWMPPILIIFLWYWPSPAWYGRLYCCRT